MLLLEIGRSRCNGPTSRSAYTDYTSILVYFFERFAESGHLSLSTGWGCLKENVAESKGWWVGQSGCKES